MASYVAPNYNPAYYSVPEFEAPIEYLSQVATQKQAQFNAGLEAVKNEHQYYLNLPLTSEGAIAKKDAYMLEANKKLRQIANANFSLSENRSAASKIYKPLTSDPYIQDDLYATKLAQKGSATANSFLTSKDEKIRKQYSSASHGVISMTIDKLRNASSHEELKKINLNNLQYVPETDYTERTVKVLQDIATKQGGSVVRDEVSGLYKIRKSNGELAEIPFMQIALANMTPNDRRHFEIVGTYSRMKDEEGLVQRYGEQEAKRIMAIDLIEREKKTYSYQLKEINAAISEGERKLVEMKLPVGYTEEQLAEFVTNQETLKSNIASQKDFLSSIQNELNARDEKYTDQIDPATGKTLFQRKLEYYQDNPDAGYANLAAHTYAKNLGTAFANATSSKTIEKNEVQFGIMDYQIKALEQQVKLAEAQAKKAKTDGDGESSGSKKQPLQTITNEGRDLTNIKQQSTYEYMMATKAHTAKLKLDEQFSLNEDVLDASNVLNTSDAPNPNQISISTLSKIKQEVANGNGSSLDASKTLSPTELEALTKIFGVKANSSYGEIYAAISNYSNKKLDDILSPNSKLNSADANDKRLLELGARHAKTKINLMNLDNVLKVTEESEKKVSNDVLSKKDYEKLRTQTADGKFVKLSEDEFFEKNGKRHWVRFPLYTGKIDFQTDAQSIFNGHPANEERRKQIEKIIGHPIKTQVSKDYTMGLIGNDLYMDLSAGDYKKLMDAHEKDPELSWVKNLSSDDTFGTSAPTQYKRLVREYEKLNQSFQEDFGKIQGSLGFFTTYKSASGQVGLSYNKMGFGFDPSAENNAEVLSKQLLTDENAALMVTNKAYQGLSKEEKGKVKLAFSYLRSAANDLKDTDGQLVVTPIGPDLKNPEYTLKLNPKFITDVEKSVTADGKGDPELTNVFKAIRENGVSINASGFAPQIENELSNQTSVVATIIENTPTSSKSFKLADGYEVGVRKTVDNQYVAIISYMDENGSPKSMKLQATPQRLDALLDDAMNTLSSYWLRTKSTQSNQNAAKYLSSEETQRIVNQYTGK